jgi:hypothetical protein
MRCGSHLDVLLGHLLARGHVFLDGSGALLGGGGALLSGSGALGRVPARLLQPRQFVGDAIHLAVQRRVVRLQLSNLRLQVGHLGDARRHLR